MASRFAFSRHALSRLYLYSTHPAKLPITTRLHSARFKAFHSSSSFLQCRIYMENIYSRSNTFLYPIISLLGLGTLSCAYLDRKQDHDHDHDHDTLQMFNWSATHLVETLSTNFLQPESTKELEQLVADAHKKGRKIRPLGSALSPNGIGFSPDGMLSMALCDKVLNVDKEKAQVTVQAGITVTQLVSALKPYGLTLQNYASIAEQQIGGFIQVGAHGTGAKVPPVEEQVVSLKLVTPAKGTIHLGKDIGTAEDKHAFHFAKLALGSLGIVSEVTLQCIPAHRLLEHTIVVSRKDVREKHAKWLKENQHIRYMWIPYTDSVIVVYSNPESTTGKTESTIESKFTQDQKLEEPRALLRKVRPEMDQQEFNSLSFFQIRDLLLAHDPLNPDFIKQVNAVEASFWKKSQGSRIEYSDRILGFDCGGQQWVSEVAFPVGSLQNPSYKDIQYMEELLQIIEKNNVPAPAPIEQRWTSRSCASLSPAYSSNPQELFSWVGIIIYLPEGSGPEIQKMRSLLTKQFNSYKNLNEDKLWKKYNVAEHWAKIEIEGREDRTAILKERTERKYPLDEYRRLKKLYDPKNICGNQLTDTLLGK